ncbi:uncharacterized protein LOC131166141 isoform X2 [Malania oleifera]|uniref:uncharacterized protein LOC131166141 isoform X2 n=1 Tax=Malania oleifera TaxID=397392 RepID=UPI0025AE4630|nr:uncharacterized protein LOC131166141 isoform X2 [Malania oleifera]
MGHGCSQRYKFIRVPLLRRHSNIYYKQAWSFTMVHNTKNSEHKLQALSIVEAPTFRYGSIFSFSVCFLVGLGLSFTGTHITESARLSASCRERGDGDS